MVAALPASVQLLHELRRSRSSSLSLTAITGIRRAHYGSGIAKSRQILRAKSSLISECRGTADERLALRFTKIE